MPLRLVPMSRHHPGETWGPNQYAVIDGDRYAGRIFRENAIREVWFWGVDWFGAGSKKLYGNAATRKAAMAAFRAAWDALPR